MVQDYRDYGVKDVCIADTFFKKFLGYMFREEPHYRAIMFKNRSSVHTFFMKFDIDVIFLDKDMNVIRKVEGLEPGKIIMPVKGAKMVIEAEAGAFVEIWAYR